MFDILLHSAGYGLLKRNGVWVLDFKKKRKEMHLYYLRASILPLL